MCENRYECEWCERYAAQMATFQYFNLNCHFWLTLNLPECVFCAAKQMHFSHAHCTPISSLYNKQMIRKFIWLDSCSVQRFGGGWMFVPCDFFPYYFTHSSIHLFIHRSVNALIRLCRFCFLFFFREWETIFFLARISLCKKMSPNKTWHVNGKQQTVSTRRNVRASPIEIK